MLEFKEGNSDSMDTSLEWTIRVGWIRFTSGYRMVEWEEENRNNHGWIKWRTSWETKSWKKLFCLEMDRRLLVV